MDTPDSVQPTLLDSIWASHVVATKDAVAGLPDILAIDLHLAHEVTSPQAFDELRDRALRVRRPDLTLATMDHSVPTTPEAAKDLRAVEDPRCRAQLEQLALNCEEFGVPIFPVGHKNQGIVHVMAPEQGLVQPGMTIVCGDSHTSTHGAFGALAFGIGTGQVAQVFATQCLLARKPSSFEIRIDGTVGRGVTAKDVILAVIAAIGTEGGTGHVFEFTGSAVRAMSMEERMTVCNMAIEGGATAGLICPDDVTFEYLYGRPFAPRNESWDAALTDWRLLAECRGATHDRSIQLDVSELEPMVTYGTSPETAVGVRGTVPDPGVVGRAEDRESLTTAMAYMGVTPGQPILGLPVDVVFVGSCTNGRLSDLREAAQVLEHRRVHERVRMVVVPGSRRVKQAAEAEGLDRVFRRAGAEWREPGCSLCLALNGDRLESGQLAVSTSNRNFEGRQGPGARTVLASPLTAAACAVSGQMCDVREML